MKVPSGSCREVQVCLTKNVISEAKVKSVQLQVMCSSFTWIAKKAKAVCQHRTTVLVPLSSGYKNLFHQKYWQGTTSLKSTVNTFYLVKASSFIFSHTIIMADISLSFFKINQNKTEMSWNTPKTERKYVLKCGDGDMLKINTAEPASKDRIHENVAGSRIELLHIRTQWIDPDWPAGCTQRISWYR